ncbi:MAG: hypothetical protein MK098_03950 [Marinovum sp.]|nr:hypothetical protein [Marinovum sp.]
MTRLLVIALCAGLIMPVAVPIAEAGPISRACNASDRKAANPRLCRCIQRAANATLTRSDQRIASKFFRDPHRAQEIRQSDRRSHEVFWNRYKRFGARAQSMCS